MTNFEMVLSALSQSEELRHLETIPTRTARVIRVPELDALPGFPLGNELWTHQATAIRHALNAESVVVSTGTASGKSLCYQVPLALKVATSPTSALPTALMVFPTKALAQDQLRSLGALAETLKLRGLSPVTYDGDTAPEARQWARKHASVLLTNPDMLHTGILPFHARWSSFLSRLSFVVIDELHTYRGVFGSHVAHVMRRLRRLCRLYGSSPVFISTSATVGDPAGLAASITGVPTVVVDDDGSPRGERLLAVWNPPADTGGMPVSGNASTARLLAAMVEQQWRTIAFTRSRRGTEVVAARAKRLLTDDLSPRVRSYRGGYLPAERRAIEAELFDGRLLGIAATNALELGVDIGGLDVTICNGFPGTISSFRQQIGRAGRSAQRSLAVLVAGDDALDQWYAAHPAQLTLRPPEPIIVNPTNPFVLAPQVACAAYEQPLEPASIDIDYADAATIEQPSQTEVDLRPDQLNDAVRECVGELVMDDVLALVNGRAVSIGAGSPASRVSLRSGGGGSEYRIVDQHDRLIGTVDGARAFSVLHQGAIYLHQGQQYRVAELDRVDHVAWVEAVQVDEYTQARSDTQLRILKVDRAQTLGRGLSSQLLTSCLGAVEVEEQVVGYQRKKISTNEVMGEEQLELPPSSLVTRAFWFEIDDCVLETASLVPAQIAGTVHAAEHAGISVLPLFTICDRWDVGGVSTPVHPQTGKATIVIYDGYPGGAGIAELGFAAGLGHLEATLDVMSRCRCEWGCPSCVQSPKCGNGNDPLDKHGAIALLAASLR
jgi:DEAD/DEAH box helicase domain-containing protein